MLVAAGYMFFHDDILRDLLDRQIEMQSAYEEQLAAARLQLDQAATRQTLDRDGVKGEIEKLVLRAAMLEMRAAAVDKLAERVSRESPREVASAEDTALPPAAPAKPEPEDWDLRLGDATPETRTRADAPAKAADADLPPEARLASLALSFDRVEREQTLRLAAVGAARDRRREPVEARVRHRRPFRRPHSRARPRDQGGAGGRRTLHPRR